MVSGAMERETEWASEKELAFREEEAGLLERKKRDIMGRKENGSHQPEPAIAGREQRSVCVVGDQGILSTDGTSGMQIREGNLFIDDKDSIQVNGKKDLRTKEFHNLYNSLVSEGKSDNRSGDIILENGSSSNVTKECDEFGVMRSEFEIEEHTHVELGKTSKLEVTEIDLEKVLEEQETHDLYCPNCNSCITKKVILRKRKRTVEETKCDTPPAKVQQLQHLNATAASADEMTKVGHDREPDVFKCLSCFNFFIPTDAGFNIFRNFGRRGETETQVTSTILPAKTGNIGLPVFKPVGSTSIASESEASFNIFRIFGRRRETESLRTSQQLPAKIENWNFFISAARTSTSESGLPLHSGSTDTSVKQKGETSMDMKASSGTTTFGGVCVGKSKIITEKNDPGVQFGAEPNNKFGEDPSFKEKQKPLTSVVSEAIKPEEGQSTTGEKDAGAKIWEYFVGAKGSMQRYLDKNESEEPNLGTSQTITGDGTVEPKYVTAPILPSRTSQFSQNINVSMVSTEVETQIYMGEETATDAGRRDWDVLKSIVYGGLIESVTSLGIVSSAAGGDASTLNIVCLALANLIGGLFVIAHDLSELRNTQEETTDQNIEHVGRYWELLGRKANSRLHATLALLSYILMGLLPPIIYGFSFRKSDNKEYKLMAVAAASLVCISLLAIGKAHVNGQRAYIKTLSYYLSLGFAASGLSYVAGVMIHRFLDQLGLYDNSAAAPVPPSDIYHGITSTLEARAAS